MNKYIYLRMYCNINWQSSAMQNRSYYCTNLVSHSAMIIFKCDILCLDKLLLGFPGGASGKEPACQHRRQKEVRVQSLGRDDPLE